ncbi:ATP-binding cassette domain-containing protein [Aminobacter sp. MSH1]|uniref:ATP-binding cassette domain-containing protein n=1 Tax=Aminobacter sp. MSH1 TaxID=374606 RepID=UPI000D3BBE48|nr:ATP-binding cassette domain-containing protein [Aminobacter sp. MSH1]
MNAATDASPRSPLLSIRGFTKRFGQIEALSDVNLDVGRAEVVALVGDNGAGKSTLIKTISGAHPADSGILTFEGTDRLVRSPKDSAALGIAFVYQDLALCDNLDVTANLYLGQELTRLGRLRNLRSVSMEAQARRLLDTFKVRTLPSLRVECSSLSGGQRQAIAIARSLLGTPKLVVLDEPTAALGVSQTEAVLNLIKQLKSEGHAVLIVSHNMADVFEVADRVIVLRLGRNAGEFPAEPGNRRDIIAAMTGIGDVKPLEGDPRVGGVAQ